MITQIKLENVYIPPLSVCDAKRKQWFTTYNVDLMNQIRKIKLDKPCLR